MESPELLALLGLLEQQADKPAKKKSNPPLRNLHRYDAKSEFLYDKYELREFLADSQRKSIHTIRDWEKRPGYPQMFPTTKAAADQFVRLSFEKKGRKNG